MSNTLLNKNQAGDGIWTQDNLVAGSGISIQHVPQPVIDENTVELFHFNDDVVDAISGNAATTSGATPSYSDGKFGKSYNNNTGSGATIYTDNTAFDSSSHSFTFDFWVKINQFKTSSYYGLDNNINLGGNSSYDISLGNNSIMLRKNIYGVGDATKTFDVSLNLSTWYHIAFVNDSTTNTNYFFFNGQLLSSWTRNTHYQGFKFYGFSYYMQLDEVRVSNVARWTSDFTPYTVPYSASAGPAQYAINNTKADPDLSSYLQNIATGSNSLTIGGAAATGDSSVNIGILTQTSNFGKEVAIGYNVTSNGSGSTGIGINTQATGTSSIAIGSFYNSEQTTANGSAAIAIGQRTSSSGQASISIGQKAQATAKSAVAIGGGTSLGAAQATAQSAIQLGTGTNNTANTFQVFNTTVVDANGKIPMTSTDVTSLTGFDATKTQVLKNVNGTLTWVDEA